MTIMITTIMMLKVMLIKIVTMLTIIIIIIMTIIKIYPCAEISISICYIKKETFIVV